MFQKNGETAMDHPVFQPGRMAVVTGAASGIGLAACKRLASFGMNVVMADMDADRLSSGASEMATHAAHGASTIKVPCDIAETDGITPIVAAVAGEDVAFLFNNAVIRDKASTTEGIETWRRVLDVNLFAVLAGVQAFAPAMIASGKPGMIVNAGSKQGITSPPGNSPYNVAKSALKTFTELLQHDLRNTPGCAVTAHLLIPGMTTTGDREHRPGAWWPDQVIDYMMPRLEAGDFYILCPDGEVTPEMDHNASAGPPVTSQRTGQRCRGGIRTGKKYSSRPRTDSGGNVEARVDVFDIARNGARPVRDKKRREIADFIDIHQTALRRSGFGAGHKTVETRDARCRPRRDRPRRQSVDPDS